MNTEPKYYNERIAWIRDCRSLSQREVAKAIGLKQQQYARYEKGVNVLPCTHLKSICEVLNVSADYIIGLSDNPKQLRG